MKLYPGFPGLNSFAQKYNFQNYSLAEGLSQSQLTAMFLDSRGNVWLGTHGGGADIFNGKSFIHHTRADGLSNNKIFSIAEDSRGNIWLGTYGDGACRFDGKSYTSFTRKEGLADNRVRSILKDSKGNLWFGTDGGGTTMLAIESQPGKDFSGVNTSTFNKDNGLGGNNVWSMMEDHQGNIWFALFDKGVTKLVPPASYPRPGKDSLTHPRWINYTIENGMPAVKVFEDSRHNIWVGTHGGGFCRIIPVGEGDSVRIVSYSKKNGFISDFAGNFVEDNNGNLWIASDDGCAIVDLSDTANYENPDKLRFIHFAEKNGLPKNRIWTMVKDNDGNIWIGTDGGGVSKYCADGFTYYTKEFGLSNNTVWSVIEDKKGNIWAGTDDGGINKLVAEDKNSAGVTFMSYKTEDGMSNNTVLSMLQDSRGNIWMGAAGRGVNRFHPGDTWQEKMTFETFSGEKKLNNAYVYSLMEDSKGNVWIGTNKSGAAKYVYDRRDAPDFQYYAPRKGTSMVMSMREDSRGFIWFGTISQGVKRYDPQQDTSVGDPFTNYNEENGLSNNYVTAIAEDDLGNMWFGTYGGGVSMLSAGAVSARAVFPAKRKENIAEKQRLPWEYFSVREGLCDDAVGQLLFDDLGNLWICTIKGINKLDIKEYRKNGRKQFRYFGRLEGFLGIEGTAICKDRKGNLWFGSPDMLIKYNPKEDKPNMTEPLTYITGIRLFYENVDWIEFADSTTPWYFLPVALSLPYNQNHLSFDFTGMSLRIPEKVRYQFMLEGLDENWSPVTQKNEAVYSNIPPGEYTFKVIACNNDGLWNKEPAVFSFVITPPFWQTWWFRITCFLLLVAGIWSYINYRERSLKEQKRVLEEKVDERTKELKEEKEKVEIQKEEIELRNVLITDSIDYAKRIQDAALPPPEHVKTRFPDSFVLLKPKDVVSGDFFWMHRQNGNIMLAAADCTGHGVPGAFMSIICNNILNNIVTTQNSLTPGTILKLMSEQLINRLKQREGEGVLKDGLDIALCCLKYTSDGSVVERSRNHRVIATLQYAGAHNPLYIISNGELSEIKADKLFIGITEDASDITFTEHSVKLKKGDCIYIFSDGFVDQKGGQKGKKFYYPPFQQLLVDIHQKSMEEQKEILNTSFENWKGDREQMDDVLVIGIRL